MEPKPLGFPEKRLPLRYAVPAMLAFLAGCGGDAADNNPVHAVSLDGVGESGVFTGVSTMNQTKDRIGNERSPEWIDMAVKKAKELGAEYIRIEQPYDNPSAGDAVAYTREWIRIIRANGLRVIHAHMFTQMEGIYGHEGKPNFNLDYIAMMQQYIADHPDFFEPGDKFMPFIEPAERGVNGMNCEENCKFESVAAYNQFLVDAVEAAREELRALPDGVGSDVEVVCCGDNGFAYWGDNNEGHIGQSFIYPSTVEYIGAIALHHYPAEGASWDEDLSELRRVWPDTKVYVIEFGAIHNYDTSAMIDEAVTAFAKHDVRGVVYFQLGPAGLESLIEESFNETQYYDRVKHLIATIKRK